MTWFRCTEEEYRRLSPEDREFLDDMIKFEKEMNEIEEILDEENQKSAVVKKNFLESRDK